MRHGFASSLLPGFTQRPIGEKIEKIFWGCSDRSSAGIDGLVLLAVPADCVGGGEDGEEMDVELGNEPYRYDRCVISPADPAALTDEVVSSGGSSTRQVTFHEVHGKGAGPLHCPGRAVAQFG